MRGLWGLEIYLELLSNIATDGGCDALQDISTCF